MRVKIDSWKVLLGSLFVVAVLFVAGCSSSGSNNDNNNNVCPAGTKNCPCDNGTCNEGLECKDGYCVPGTSCNTGDEGCKCYDNNTCNGDLQCIDGICQNQDCPAGTEGCACIDGTTCNQGLECNDNGICQRAGCTPGTEGCECDNGACNEGLECIDDICKEPTHVTEKGFKVGNGNVRACDVLFDIGSSKAESVKFADVVIGRSVKRKTKIAVSFTAKADSSLDTAPIFTFVDSSGNGIQDVSGISVVEVHCFDRKGAVVSDPQVSLK